ncbi:MAG: ABC transporter ATP-binding protein [Patescibacteria group bacterium]|nr:ABC transporter ATP-binding protein/permease [Patescibacteria group bacterium]MDE1965780.1 ABC transporter ATP-binding protein [Patescibacteria group bacterium]
MARKVSVLPVLRVYSKHTARYPVAALLAVSFAVLAKVIDVIVPLYYKRFFDLVATSVPGPAAASALVSVLVVIFLLLLSRMLSRRVNTFATIWLEPRVMRDLAQTCFSYLIDHSYSFFANSFTGSLVRRLNRLSRSYEDVLDRFLFDIIPLVVTLLGIIVVLFLRNAWLGVIFLIWTFLVLGLQLAIARINFRNNLLSSEKDSEATGVLSDSLANDMTVKIFTGEAHERGLYAAVSEALSNLRYKSWLFGSYVDAVQSVLMIGIEFVLMYAGIVLWRDGALTIGDFALIQAYLIAAIEQLWNFGNIIRRLYEAFADSTEMVDILDLPHEIQDRLHAGTLAVAQGGIEFKSVDFNFSETRSVLKDFNLSIKGKEKVALVGPSGAGKTTITKLLFRFHDVTAGGIFIDGQNIASVTQESLRWNMALVPQEPILFHRTLMENIRYGRRDATDEEVRGAAKQAHCEEFIANTPYGYETYVGERGIKLSGGERQRIAIARAILKDAPILVLDEATSSLDSESEALIQDALTRLMEGKTVIAIAHRLSTVMRMDRIIVIEGGKVVTSGTHDELLRHEGGLYKKLWEIQAGGFITGDGA